MSQDENQAPENLEPQESQEPAAKTKPSKKQLKEMASRIAFKLGEKDVKPRQQIYKIISVCGLEYTEALVEQTKEVEANGGMMTFDGQRRRTMGGVFFQLARQQLSDDQRERIFNSWRYAVRQHIQEQQKYPKFEFEDRAAMLENVLNDETGEMSEMKISLTGRPGPIERRQELVITTMEFSISEGFAMPRGVPELPVKQATYVLYIASKHWENVEKALEDEKDELVVDGLCAFDPEIDKFAVYATFATTKKLQKKERKATKQVEQSARDKEKAQKEKAPRSNGKKTSRPQAEKPAATPAAPEPVELPPMPDLNLPEGVPPEVAQKLGDFVRAADTYRRKIAMLEAKPANQQHGLEMTRKLLGGIERKIDALKKEHSIEV